MACLVYNNITCLLWHVFVYNNITCLLWHVLVYNNITCLLWYVLVYNNITCLLWHVLYIITLLACCGMSWYIITIKVSYPPQFFTGFGGRWGKTYGTKPVEIFGLSMPTFTCSTLYWPHAQVAIVIAKPKFVFATTTVNIPLVK